MPRLIDLSQEIYTGMPSFPAVQKTIIYDFKTHAEHLAQMPNAEISFATKAILLSDHGPTHVDAFSHMEPGGESIDQLDLSLFYTPAVCLDVSGVAASDTITPQILENAYQKAVVTQDLPPTVLLYTAHYDRAYGKAEWNKGNAGLDKEGMEWLADRGVKNVGIDAPTIDNTAALKTKNFPAHGVCRDRKILNMENLANLSSVSNREFIFIGFPLKIRGATASPIRAVALLEG